MDGRKSTHSPANPATEIASDSPKSTTFPRPLGSGTGTIATSPPPPVCSLLSKTSACWSPDRNTFEQQRHGNARLSSHPSSPSYKDLDSSPLPLVLLLPGLHRHPRQTTHTLVPNGLIIPARQRPALGGHLRKQTTNRWAPRPKTKQLPPVSRADRRGGSEPTVVDMTQNQQHLRHKIETCGICRVHDPPLWWVEREFLFERCRRSSIKKLKKGLEVTAFFRVAFLPSAVLSEQRRGVGSPSYGAVASPRGGVILAFLCVTRSRHGGKGGEDSVGKDVTRDTQIGLCCNYLTRYPQKESSQHATRSRPCRHGTTTKGGRLNT